MAAQATSTYKDGTWGNQFIKVKTTRWAGCMLRLFRIGGGLAGGVTTLQSASHHTYVKFVTPKSLSVSSQLSFNFALPYHIC